jgi:regulator of replication initiation timing
VNSNEAGPRLHDKATRGGVLSASEAAELQAWYAQQDGIEQEAICRAGQPQENLALLREQVDEALAQLNAVTGRIQKIVTANDGLRQDIAVLKRRLAQLPVPQSA